MSNRSERLACGFAVLLLSAAAQGAPDLLPADGLSDAGLWRYWQVALPLASGESLTAIHQAEDNIYCVTNRGIIFTVHADTGVIRWAEQVVLPGGKVFAPTHRVAKDGERQVVVATSTHLRLYGVEYGDPRGSIGVTFAPNTPAVGDAERVYVGGLNGRFYCYRLADRLRIWHVRGTKPISATPRLRGEDLYFASQDGRIFACRARDKVARWDAEAETTIHGDLAVGERMVYVAGGDRHVHAFDRDTGIEIWRRQLAPTLLQGPLLAGDTLYQVGEEAGVFALAPDTGEVQWAYPQASPGTVRDGTRSLAFLARGGERVYVVDGTGGGVVLNNTSGEPIAGFEAAAADLTLANTIDETLYLASRRGVLVCVRRREAPVLRRALPARVAVADGRAAPVATTQPAAELPKAPSPVDEIINDPFRSRSKVPPLVGRASEVSATEEPEEAEESEKSAVPAADDAEDDADR